MASQFDMDVEVAETPTHKRSRRYEDEKMDVDAEEHVRVVPLVYPNNCTWDAASGVLRSIPGEERRSLAVNPEALEFLRSLNPSRKLGTISICGPARTGKSLVAGECVAPGVVPCPFALGHTMNACTYGIWIGLRAVSSSSSPGEEMDILVMDVEGTGFHQSDAHADYQLMVCALLLSSTLVYNSKGVFDKDSIDKIQFVLDLTNRISSQGAEKEQGREFKHFFPSFVWLLRDCHLDAAVDRRTRSVRDYLTNHVLACDGGMDFESMRRDHIRTAFQCMFPGYDAHALPFPTSDADVLATLGTVDQDLSSLNPEFLKGLQSFTQQLCRNVEPKRIFTSFEGGSTSSVECNGRSFADWIEYCVSAVNDGVPNILSLGENVMTNVYDTCAMDGIEEYRRQMQQRLLHMRRQYNCEAVRPSDINSAHGEVLNFVMTKICFHLESDNSNPRLIEIQCDISQRFQREIAKVLQQTQIENNENIRTYCEDWLHSNYESINEMMNEPSRHDMNAVIDAMKRFQDGYFSLHVRGAKQFDDAWSKQEKIMESDRNRFHLLQNYNAEQAELKRKEDELRAEKHIQEGRLQEENLRNEATKQQITDLVERHREEHFRQQRRLEEQNKKQSQMIESLQRSNNERMAEYQRTVKRQMDEQQRQFEEDRRILERQLDQIRAMPPQQIVRAQRGGGLGSLFDGLIDGVIGGVIGGFLSRIPVVGEILNLGHTPLGRSEQNDAVLPRRSSNIQDTPTRV